MRSKTFTLCMLLGSSRSIRATSQPDPSTAPGLFTKWIQPDCCTVRVITIFITCEHNINKYS